MKISSLVSAIPPSQTLAIDAKAKAMVSAGKDVVSFAAGEPDFDTPEIIRNAAKAALNAGLTRYGPVAGYPDLRKAISEKYKKEYNLDYAPEQTIVTCGGKHALYEIFRAVIDPGDEVIVPAPYWVSYPPMIELAGGTPVILPTDESTGFTATAAAVESVLTAKTRVLVLNSPSNPTGGAYSRKQLEELAEIAIQKDLIVISDEIYEKLTYEGFEFTCFPTVDARLVDRTVIANGLSKTYAMTGWRLGYALGPKNLISALANLQSQSTSNMPTFAQKAAAVALRSDPSILTPMLEAFARRRTLILDLLADIPDVTCFRPQGAFYVFPNVSAYYGKKFGVRKIADSFSMAEYLLEEALVAVVPGGAFASDANIRLSYATGEDAIRKGLARIAEALKALK